jgi:hypothetical protein
MIHSLYEILLYPFRFTWFHGEKTPFLFQLRGVGLVYYYNVSEESLHNRKNVQGKNYSSHKFIGYKASLYHCYKRQWKRLKKRF